MSRLIKVIRSHQEINRTRRQLNRAIAYAATPAMRDELILVAQRDGKVFYGRLPRTGPCPIRTRPFVMSGLASSDRDSGGCELLCDVAAELGQRR